MEVKILKKLLALLLALLMTFSLCSTAFAADVEEEAIEEEPVVSVAQKTHLLTNGNHRIYTGIGKAQWLHIYPNSFNIPIATIQMIDYSGGEVWRDSIDISQTSHWYVGANVQYVNIIGGVGSIIVTHTDN